MGFLAVSLWGLRQDENAQRSPVEQDECGTDVELAWAREEIRGKKAGKIKMRMRMPKTTKYCSQDKNEKALFASKMEQTKP